MRTKGAFHFAHWGATWLSSPQCTELLHISSTEVRPKCPSLCFSGVDISAFRPKNPEVSMPDSSISKEQLGKSCKLTRVTRFRWGKYRRAWWRALMTYLGSTGKPPCKRQRIEYQAQSPSVAHGVETRRRADEGMKQFIQQHKSAVPYVSQSFSWDCGLACTEMALRARGVKKVRCRVCARAFFWQY